MNKSELEARKEIIAACGDLITTGLNKGMSGNVSMRHGDKMLITPSAVMVDDMTPDMIAAMPFDGEYGQFEGPLAPSSEWYFHFDILSAREDAGAVVHTHAPYCTTLAMCRKPIPACHYMIYIFGGHDIRCAGYTIPGTKELSLEVLRALEDRTACLLANHGMIVLGEHLQKAMWHAVELENLAAEYYRTLAIGGPTVLSEGEMAEFMTAAKDYGVQTKNINFAGENA